MTAFTSILMAILFGVAAGLAVLFWRPSLRTLAAGRARTMPAPALTEPRRFVFRNGYLIEHSDEAGFLLPAPVDHLRAWDVLAEALEDMLDGVPEAFAALRASGRSFRLEGPLGRDAIHVLGSRVGDDLHVTVAASDASEASMRIGVEGLRGMEAEVALLTDAADTSPHPNWAADMAGRVVWANAAYHALAVQCAPPETSGSWPLPILFPEASRDARTGRARVLDTRGRAHWFTLAASGAAGTNGLTQHHATPIDAVVAAEESLGAFVQTLTKTFAHLPTGLAIFDRERALVMFNPALVDMTGLDAVWLSRRPRIEDFFDALRERRHLPEPRDYKGWRDGLRDHSRVDARGTYVETWSLPDGQTYRVTGRPQADGAVALMLEDVTADVSAENRHRTEREALAATLDLHGEAVFVFDVSGRRIGASATARGRGVVLPEDLGSAIALWRTDYEPSPAWADLRAAARGEPPAAASVAWTESLRRHDGTETSMRVLPLPMGGIAVGFEAGGRAEAGPIRLPDSLRIAGG
jgi:PAS domain-containing protein